MMTFIKCESLLVPVPSTKKEKKTYNFIQTSKCRNSIQLQPNSPTIHSHFPLSLPILKLLSMAPTLASFVLITQTFISFWLTKLFLIQSA